MGRRAVAVQGTPIETFLSHAYSDIIKGNEGDVEAVSKPIGQQRGMDSGSSTLSEVEKTTLVRDLSRESETSSL